MGINIDWGKILSTLIAEVAKLFLPKARDLLEWAIDWAYTAIEEWATQLSLDEEHVVPASVEKMAKAVELVRVLAPEIQPAAARMLLEAKHLKVTG